MRVNQWIKKTRTQHLRCCDVVWVHDSSKMIVFFSRFVLFAPFNRSVYLCFLCHGHQAVCGASNHCYFSVYCFLFSLHLLLLSLFSLLFQFREVNKWEKIERSNKKSITIEVKEQLNKSQFDFEPNIDSPFFDCSDCCAFVNTFYSFIEKFVFFFFAWLVRGELIKLILNEERTHIFAQPELALCSNATDRTFITVIIAMRCSIHF